MSRAIARVVVAFSLLAAPLAAEAQPAGKVYRLGIFNESPAPPPGQRTSGPLIDALLERGWVEGRNLVVEARHADRAESLPRLAAELVSRNVDVIVVGSVRTLQEAYRATRTIPIVMVGAAADPIGLGLVASLARPGGNVTGLTFTGVEMQSKRLELLKEIAPRVTRIAFFGRTHYVNFERVKLDAPSLGISVIPVEAEFDHQYPGAFATVTRERADGLFVDSTNAAFVHVQAA